MPRDISEQFPLEVLVVDDEPDVRELLIEHLRGRGYRTASAADGRAAVNAIERSPAQFTVVITDLYLPGVGGLDVLRAARTANPSCYVVIVTGYASIDSAVQAVRLGAYDYLTKPFSLGQIDVVLQRITDRLALERENRELSRRMSDRDPVTPSGIMERLGTIESRLESMERVLADLVTRLR